MHNHATLSASAIWRAPTDPSAGWVTAERQGRAAGFSEAQIVAPIAEHFVRNLINNVATTDVDFPTI